MATPPLLEAERGGRGREGPGRGGGRPLRPAGGAGRGPRVQVGPVTRTAADRGAGAGKERSRQVVRYSQVDRGTTMRRHDQPPCGRYATTIRSRARPGVRTPPG